MEASSGLKKKKGFNKELGEARREIPARFGFSRNDTKVMSYGLFVEKSVICELVKARESHVRTMACFPAAV